MIYAALILFMVVFRIMKAFWLPDSFWTNVCPIMALCYGGGLVLPKKLALWFPLCALMMGDVGIYLMGNWGLQPDWNMRSVVYLMMAVATIDGKRMREDTNSLKKVIGIQLFWTLWFYVVTNTVSFFLGMGYEMSMKGWIQALTVGLPGYLPTWSFLLRSILADGLMLGVLLMVFNWREPVRSRLKWQCPVY